jgi:nucleotide-binding universal stress UspA family protein
MYKHILVPLDGSELARAALPHAIEVAKCTGADLTVFTVVEPGSYPWICDPYGIAPTLAADEVEQERDDRLKQAKSCVEAVASEISAHDIVVHGETAVGDPASCICEYAREASIDLIVMSTHGRSGIAQWVYGSVASKVLHGASVPVLLVRAMAR